MKLGLIFVNVFQESLPFMHYILAVEKIVFCDFSSFPSRMLDFVNHQSYGKIWDHAI